MKIKHIILLSSLVLTTCQIDRETAVNPRVNLKLNFLHRWGQSNVNTADLNNTQFTNAFGNQLNIERLRYLISEIKITKTGGEIITISNYNLLDLQDSSSLNITSSQSIETGIYNDLSFVFGFTNEANIDGAYNDLNSESWNVPIALGGGYHYMQLDGKFLNNIGVEQGYNYHAIRAVDNPGANPIFPQNTFFEHSLGPITVTENAEVNILMDIAKWFEQPNLWDLNSYNQMLMPNSAAQIMMYENGQNVFNLGAVE